MSKKILSLALAVLMLFSICSVAANAAVADGKSIGLRFESDASVGAVAGTIVNVKVYYTIPDDAGEVLLQNGPIAVAWNSEAYEPNTTSTNNTISDCRVWGDSYAGIMKSTAAVTKAPSATIISNQNKNSTNPYGWDAACQVTVTMDSGAGYSTNTGFPVDPDCEFFTISFRVKRTLTANDVIGAPDGAYGTNNFKIQAKVEGSNTPSLYAANTIDFSQAVSAPSAPAFDVYHVAAKNGDAMTRTNLDDSSKYDIGVVFGFKADTIATDFDANGTSGNITAITATITANLASGGTKTITPEGIRFIYDLSGKAKTEFGFNVIIAGIPYGDTAITSYTITPSITTNDGNTYTCETKTINVADLKFA